MTDKLITIKSPLRSIRSDDDDIILAQKLNQNNTDMWNIMVNLIDRIKELENNRFVEYVKRDADSIVVKTAQGNKKIKLESDNG